ncbi:nuclear transport factor 2 family protein [Amycolatopsis australiensis]|uniref:SnoaL-like domain-containing protein n=1 Tax=Amycolatopsis australiensis TaxID=546364 RepID=A0A1K1S2Z6_9PSEU|nr:nuclear transport factor 2 family protein [Amycolatopsis australiensis]SFW78697.1 SnoaL-like domain-containing protein [Amycolatopsis australiensis]
MTTTPTIPKLTAETRQELVDLTVSLAWHLDHEQWDELPELFTERVLLDYTSLNGGAPTLVPRADMIAKWRTNRTPLKATQHLLGNHLVTRTGETTAVATAMFQATHLLPNDQGGPLWTLGGEYAYSFVDADGTWLIDGLTMKLLWADGNRNIRDLR